MSNDPLAERESSFRGIVFNHASGVVLASYERHEERRTIRSLYLRDPITKNYERLSAPDDRTSYDSPVSARDAPYVFVNVMVVGDDEAEAGCTLLACMCRLAASRSCSR